MNRREDWPEALARSIAAARHLDFQWGQHDCAAFAASVVEAMTGEDLLGPFRGRYSDATSAQAVLKAAGHRSLYHFCCSTFGQPVHVSRAGRGDLALARGEDGPALGIFTGKDALFVGEAQIGGRTVQTGLVAVPKSEIKHAFKVGS